MSSTIPQNATDGQYFVYSGNTVTNWTYSKIYKYNEGTDWEELDATLPQNQDYYMRCLKDILQLNDVDDGYFAVIFAQAFFANTATLNSLAVRNINLKENGNIQSEETIYIPNEQGLLIDAYGNIQAFGDTHIGGVLRVDGECNIRGNANYYGNISSGPLFLSNLKPTKVLLFTRSANSILYWNHNMRPAEFFGDGVDGYYNNKNYYYVETSYRLASKERPYGNNIYRYTWYFIYKFYDVRGNLVDTIELLSDPFMVANSNMSQPYGGQYVSFPYEITVYGYIPEEGKTMKLIDLPRSAPQEDYVVYLDGNTVKVKLPE